MIKKITAVAVALLLSLPAFAAPTVQQVFMAIYNASKYHDIGAMKELTKNYSVDTMDERGNTSLCYAVAQGDYRTYDFLEAFGASSKHKCMTNIHPQAVNNFYATKPPSGTFFPDNYFAAGGSGISTNTLLIGGGVAVAAGGIAIAAGGGGGGGGSGNSGNGGDDGDGNGDDGGYIDDPADFVDSEFMGSIRSGSTNFLGKINAHHAYARGFAGEGVKVGVIDNGVSTTHPDLPIDASEKGFSYAYGPCSGAVTTNCYNYSGGKLMFYNATGNAAWAEGYDMPAADWSNFLALFPTGYDWNTAKNSSDPVGSSQDHGTHVAGIIAALRNGSGMQGVAYKAQIVGGNLGLANVPMLAIDVYNSFARMRDDYGVNIINNSWNSSVRIDASTYTAAKQSVTDNASLGAQLGIEYTTTDSFGDDYAIIVFAAGNDDTNANKQYQSSVLSGLPLIMPDKLLYVKSGNNLVKYSGGTEINSSSDLNNVVSSLVVNVVAVDAGNNLTAYSSKCGITAKWCIAAPGGYVGGQIASTVPGGGYDLMMGTSMAAPVVSGSLAVILSADPHLKPEQAVEILFRTATNIGSADLYGWGLVNLQAATSPVGLTGLAAGNTTGAVVDFSGSLIKLPGYFNFTLMQEQLPDNILVLDEYKRSFAVPTAAIITSAASKQSFADSFAMFNNPDALKEVEVSERFSMSYAERAFSQKAGDIGVMGMKFRLSDTHSFSFRYSEDEKYQGNYFSRNLRNPFDVLHEAYRFENRMALDARTDLTVAFAQGKNGFIDRDEDYDYANENKAYSFSAELDYKVNRAVSVGFIGGMLKEENSALGMKGDGAFRLGDSASYFGGLSVTVRPADRLTLKGVYYYGMTDTGAGNPFVSLTDMKSDSFAFDASYELNDVSKVGLQFSSPLRISKGSAVFDIPIGRDAMTDEVYRVNFNSSLAAEKRELNLGVYYNLKYSESTQLNAEAGVRFNPDNRSDIGNDWRILLGMTMKF